MGTLRNLQLAELAVRNVNKVLPLGADNSVYSPSPDEALMANSIARSELALMNSDFHIERVAAHAKTGGAGNCKEMAMIAFTFLRKNLAGSVSLELIGVNSPAYGMHIFVALGRAFPWPVAAGLESVAIVVGAPSGWGANVVVCDPWLNLWDTTNNAGGRDGVYNLASASLFRLGASRPAEI